MWLLDGHDCYAWTVFNDDGLRCLQSAPLIGNGLINPEECCDVSVYAFDESELNRFVDELARAAQQPRVVVRGWIRG
jgi:hypothetical protein